MRNVLGLLEDADSALPGPMRSFVFFVSAHEKLAYSAQPRVRRQMSRVLRANQFELTGQGYSKRRDGGPPVMDRLRVSVER
jgi:hypothetical protein